MDEDIVLTGDEEVATYVPDITELHNTLDEVAAGEDTEAESVIDLSLIHI